MAPKSSKEEDKKIQEFKDRISKEAEHFLHVVFPEKVKSLDAMLQSELFNKDNAAIHHDINIPRPAPAFNGPASECEAGDGAPAAKKLKSAQAVSGAAGAQGTPVYCLPAGAAPCNEQIVGTVDVVKPLIKALVEQTNSMKMWILFLIPKIEDGNNFGVSVQEETLAEVRQVESEAATYLDQLARYFITRGKLVSKLAKYPHIDDYRRAIDEIDEKEYLSLKLTVSELRNNYSSLHDLIIKNLDKITTPRTATNMHIY